MTSKKTIRWIARVLFVWMSTIWPAQVQWALAQSVPQIPNVPPGQYDIQNAITNRQEDVQTESTQINRRAQKLSNGWVDPSTVRSAPTNATTDGVPVRSPRSTTDDTPVRTKDPITVQDSVTAAQRSSDFGQQIFNSVPRPDPSTVSFDKPGPENKTQPGKVNIREVIPSYSQTELEEMKATGKRLYEDTTTENNSPGLLMQAAEQNNRNMRRAGCRKTDFTLLERQNITQASSDATQRILKVEFYDIKKEPIPNTNPVQYNITYTKTTYKKGNIKLSFATIGGTEQQWWDMVGDDFGILYTYTPYTQPKNRNFFTYNHQIAVKQGGVITVYPNAVASYGSAQDAFTTVPAVQIPYGVDEVYVSADLYRTEVNYFDPGIGNTCPPDPPNTCEVASIGGDVLRWCGNSPGANIYNMYDDTANPTEERYGRNVASDALSNSLRKDYRSDNALLTGVNKGYTASQQYPDLVGQCERRTISSKTLSIDTSYDNQDIYTCSEALINPYPNGCPNIKRVFGLSALTDQNFLTVRAFQKVKQPIIDPKTGKQALDANGNPMWTYTKQPANVSGPIQINVPVMGASQCVLGNNTPTGKCSNESVPDKEEYILEYDHTPAALDPKQYVVNGVYIPQGGTASVSFYGRPTDGWTPTGSATADGTYAQVRVMARVYQVTINQFSGCEDYMNYVADGICQGAKLTCLETSPTRTVGDVTFGPGLPNAGIVDVLKAWGTDASEVFPNYSDPDSGDPTDSGAPIKLLDDPMCWQAKGETFTACYVMPNNGNVLTQFTRNGQIWATDCDKTPDPNGVPLIASPTCRKVTGMADCDSRWFGLFTRTCYNPTIAYDCGDHVNSKFDVTVDEKADFCSGAIRCMGTECHRPNLVGDSRTDFVQATAGLSSLDMGKMDMVCAETGEKPTSADQQCTPMIFGGKSRYCKIPIGSDIGITPNCCTEAKKAAGQADVTWWQYLKLTFYTYKILDNKAFKTFVFDYSASYPYTAASKTFGSVSQPITDMYKTSADFVQQNMVKPFTNFIDNLAQKFIGRGVFNPGETPIDSPSKGSNVFDFIDNFEQEIYKNIYNSLPQGLADMIFSKDAAGKITLQLLPESIILAFEIYAWLSLIGHIIFACKEEEFQWGLDNKLRLCSFAGTCCSKKLPLIGCIEKRQLYCCYKSIAARVIAEQIVKKNLDGKHPYGYKTSFGGGKLKKCSINCMGFGPDNLSNVDWSQVDLSEWTDALIQSGILNPNNLQADFGVTSTGVTQSNALARQNVNLPQLDQADSPALKNSEILQSNVSTLTSMTQELRAKTPCYIDPKKMPMYDPACDQILLNQGNN